MQVGKKPFYFEKLLLVNRSVAFTRILIHTFSICFQQTFYTIFLTFYFILIFQLGIFSTYVTGHWLEWNSLAYASENFKINEVN